MSNKKFILIALLVPLLFVIPLFILLYVYDPFQVYHKPYFREATFFRDMRRQNKGIIKNYDFDSYILGTSMLENTLAKDANEKLGGKWVNISMAGSRFNERAVVLDYILRTKSPRHIMYSLDIYGLDSYDLVHNFEYLYDDNVFNDIKSSLSLRFISCALIYSTKEKCVGSVSLDGLDGMLSWAKAEWATKLFGGFENWLKYRDGSNQLKEVLEFLRDADGAPLFVKSDEAVDISKIKENLENNILRFVRENPQTEFSIIIPTYFRGFYHIPLSVNYYPLMGPKAFYAYKQTMQWLIPYAAQFKNLKFYAFDTLPYADDIRNYKDLTHYNTSLNHLQLDAIRDKTHILDSSNIAEYLEIMESKILAYNIASLVKMAKEWENKP